MITYVFPGQGSQYKTMGDTLFDEFKELIAQADDILGYSMQRLCMENPYSYLNQTQFTQPALYVVSTLSYLRKIQHTATKPDFVAGHSVGEYTALFAAGAFDFETGLKLVQKRGEIMSRTTGGAMAAVVGLNEQQVVHVLEDNNLNTIDVANYNTPLQIVISGYKEDIEKAQPIFEAVQGIRVFKPLNVNGAFHSRYMREAQQEFEKFLQGFNLYPLSIPVISNVYARPYEQGKLKRTVVDQITSTVKWTKSIQFLMEEGPMEFEEIGPGTVLTGLIKKIQ